MITTETAIMLAFLLTNVARVLAYLPQIIAIARDEGRARAVSCATWSLFFVSISPRRSVPACSAPISR